ncbi:MAG: bifunctional (p)ppGpp synthetase/guanosine-3',5'-bis(diphosphate) 3'-pyrophosphohydrolase [Chloroflexi bacterium]|nr:bifunctional (p)ppGpp synthetase/guanosine-3',5'-bis(diphosphate) 3'-pyrophosphohydrolase [Chloroflexota bacterium]
MTFDRAIVFAALAHAHQVRKGTQAPYIVHPFGVAMLLLQAGCAEEVVVAGLLHDTLEDTGVGPEALREAFGPHVLSVIAVCSEPDKSLPWKERKAHSLATLPDAPLDVRLVSCADKLQNVRSMRADWAEVGEALWERFREGRDEQAWYYRGLVAALRPHEGEASLAWLHGQLEAEVRALFGLAPHEPEGEVDRCA